MKTRKTWLIIGIVIALMVLSASLAGAQQIVVAEGDTLDIRIVTLTDTVTVVRTDTLTVTDTVTIVVVDTVFVGDTIPAGPGGRLSLSEAGGTITGEWTDGNGQAHRYRIGPNNSEATLSGQYWSCVYPVDNGVQGRASCNRVTVGGGVQVSFRIPEPVPMEGGLMVQAVFPLDDVRPIGEYVATLSGEPGNLLPADLGWYWLPAPPTGEITVSGLGQTWTGSY